MHLSRICRRSFFLRICQLVDNINIDSGANLYNSVYVHCVKMTWSQKFEYPLYDRSQFLQETGLNNVQSNIQRVKKCMIDYQKLTAKFIAQIWNERQTLIAIWNVCFCLVIVFSWLMLYIMDRLKLKVTNKAWLGRVLTHLGPC